MAGTFIFSGFVKAVDPLGTCYKIEDYIEAFGFTSIIPEFLPIILAILLVTVEFTLGIFLLFGIRRYSTSLLTLFIMCVMTPFTLYLALTDPVSECGCFGDAWPLTNWHTFGKNIILLIAAIVVFGRRYWMFRFISRRNQWIVSLYALLFIVLFSWVSL